MARGDLPAQTPQVPKDLFLSFDLIYQFLQNFSKDVSYLEGQTSHVNTNKISTTVLGADGILTFPLSAFESIRFDVEMYVTGNFKYRLTGPAAPGLILFSREKLDAGAITTNFDSAYSGADIVVANPSVVRLAGIIQNGATAGDVAISWAQNASNVTPTTIYAGSVLRYSPVA